MNNFGILFKSVDPSNRAELVEKGFVAAKTLRIFAVIAVVITLVIAVPIILASGILGGVGIATSEVNVPAAAAVAGGVTAAFLASLLLIIGMIGQLLTLWYTGKLKRQLENNETPGIVLPVIFLLFTLLAVYGSIRPELSIIGLALNGFIAYLWIVVITTINKLNNA